MKTNLDSEPDAPENFSFVSYPEELVVLCGRVELSRLLIDKECVRNPDKFDVVGTNHELVNSGL